MFGMLDYRAHKLYWLILLPFTIIAKLGFFAVVFISIIIAEKISAVALFKIILAYIIMEALSLFIYLPLWLLISGAIKKAFFWLIDIVPAYGANPEEAEVVVLQGGKLFQLSKKFNSEIENWTNDDTRSFVSLVWNWRARLFFKTRKRFSRVVEKLQQVHQETGQEPSALESGSIEKIRKGVEDGHITWVEKAIVTPQIFNSILGFVIIVISVCYIGG